MTTPATTPADGELKLTAEERKRIASAAHTDCVLIPGATHYNAAEFAIDAVLKHLNAARTTRAPVTNTADDK